MICINKKFEPIVSPDTIAEEVWQLQNLYKTTNAQRCPHCGSYECETVYKEKDGIGYRAHKCGFRDNVG